MRLFLLVDGLGVGGAEKSLLAILAHLTGIEATVCSISTNLALRSDFEAVGATVYSLEQPRSVPGWGAWRRLDTLIRRERPDLLHASGAYAGLMGRVVGRRLRLPVVASFISESYTRAHYASLPWRSRINLAILHGAERMTARWVDHVIANSETVRQTNAASIGIPLQKISVLYRGRDPQPFMSPDAARSAGLVATLPQCATRPRLVNVARLIPIKGQMELVRAMPIVLERYPNASLLVAGEGHFRGALAQAIAAMRLENHVHLLGTVDAVPELLALSDLFVFASHFEGLPGAVIEAMLAGKPIVTVDIPVHRELIEHGRTGWLAPTRDPAALAAGIVHALDHPEEAAAWGRAAQADALARFSIETVAARYAELYRRLAEP